MAYVPATCGCRCIKCKFLNQKSFIGVCNALVFLVLSAIHLIKNAHEKYDKAKS